MTVRLAQAVGMRKISDFASAPAWSARWRRCWPWRWAPGETTPFKLTGGLFGLRQRRPPGRAAPDRADPGPRGQDHLPRRRPRLPALQRRPTTARTRRCIARPGRQIMDPVTAYQITSMLRGRGAARHGDRGARSLGRPVGGKTGTTNDYRSAWFVGFSPDYRGRRLRRLRRQPLAGQRRGGRRRGAADLHRLHAARR